MKYSNGWVYTLILGICRTKRTEGSLDPLEHENAQASSPLFPSEVNMYSRNFPFSGALNRRHFVKMLGAPLAWAASPRVFGQVGTGYPNTVTFVPDPGSSGLTPDEQQLLFTVDTTVSAAIQADTYPQSVASGDPQPSGIVLWTRINPGRQGGSLPMLAGWQIATSADFSPDSLLIEGATELDPSKDNTVKLPVSHGALAPYTGYFYRFIYNQTASRTGQFKTLPAPDASLASLRLGYIVCQDYGNGYYTALTHLANEQLDYLVHLGDYIYETISSGSFQNAPVRTVPAFPSGSTTLPVNVDDYRHLYKVYRSDANLQAVHERFTCIQLWDDHEFANDCHQDYHPDNNTPPDTASTPQPDLRQAANQAWSEYSLADVAFDSSQSWEESIKVYRTFSFGSLAELIVTDERLYRDGPPCGDNEIGQRYFTLGCEAMHDQSRTMLGATQLAWFLNEITTTNATWKLWANEVMLMQLKAGLIYVDLDQWDGYQQERNAILNAVKHNHVSNFVALTGDLHTFLAGYLKTDFDNPFESPVGIELMVGSISSANFAEEIESAVPLPSAPLPAKQMGVPPNLLAPVIHVANPWIQYWDSSTHGYGVLTLTPQQLVCEFKAVTTVQQPTADLVPLKTFTVPAGETKLLS